MEVDQTWCYADVANGAHREGKMLASDDTNGAKDRCRLRIAISKRGGWKMLCGVVLCRKRKEEEEWEEEAVGALESLGRVGVLDGYVLLSQSFSAYSEIGSGSLQQTIHSTSPSSNHTRPHQCTSRRLCERFTRRAYDPSLIEYPTMTR